MTSRVPGGRDDPSPTTLTPDRWRAIKDLLRSALDLAPEERATFLDRACGGDPALRREVETLLAAHDGDSGFLARPALHAMLDMNVAPDNVSEADAERPARIAAALADRYTLERELGRGGMATVYLARDVRHGRQVAVKVLHPDLAAALGAQRFLAEIRTTASLQHPHILPLFDSGETAGHLYYVMPYVAGETLRVRLTRDGQLPVTDAVRVAIEVAGGLDYAHRHGVVHRDVKPENILLGDDGQALVADFGIALALSHAGRERLTQTGFSLGTPRYMAPEQVTGERAVDARADVYALGCVLYEMLAGEPPFTGPNARAVVARVLTETPRSLAAQRASVPPAVDIAVRTALEKLPADRFPSAADFASALTTPVAQPSMAPTLPHRLTKAALRRALFGGAVLAAAVLGWTLRSVMIPTHVEDGQPVRFIVEPDSARLSPTTATISPDDRTIVYSAEGPQGIQLYARRLDELSPRPLRDTEGAAWPFFSPDGAWVGFYAAGAIRRVPLAGGSATSVVEVAGSTPFGPPAWGDDGMIYYTTAAPNASGAYRVPAGGGAPTQVAPDDSAGFPYHAAFRARPVPGGRALLISRTQLGTRVGVVMEVRDLRTGRVRPLGPGVAPHYAQGYLVYVQPNGRLYRRPFDVKRLAPTGPEEEVARDILRFDVSPSGALVYQVGVPTTPVTGRLTLVDRGGRVVQTLSTRAPWTPRFAPDGRRIAFAAFAPGETVSDVWVSDLVAGTTARLTVDSTHDGDPQWSPDGQALVYSAARPGAGADVFVQSVAGGAPRRLTNRPGAELPSDWSPDGRTVAFTAHSDTTGNDIWLQPVDGGTARPYLATPANEAGLRVSPNDHWAAYMSDETGRWEVYVQSYPTPGHKALVSAAGGVNPVWGRDGKSLYYWQLDPQNPQGSQMIAASLGLDSGGANRPLVVRGRTPLFRASYLGIDRISVNPIPLYDVAPDGSRIALLTAPPPENRLVVALHALTRH